MMKSKILTGLVFLAVLAFTSSLAVRAEVGRDEHMYVAGGFLVGSEGLMPYRDFPFVHLPYLLLAEAFLFRFTDAYFLAARFLSALCATGVAVSVYVLSERFARHLTWGWRFGIAAGSTLLLVGNPLYVFMAGRAWNQAPASLLAVMSLLVFVWNSIEDGDTKRLDGWMLGSGILLGLAVGTRSSYVTLVPVFAGALFLMPGSGDLKVILRRGIFFGVGLTAALAPILYYYLAAPDQFVFGNVEFHRLSTVFRVESNYDGPISLAERWAYFWNSVLAQPGNLILLIGVIYFGLTAGIARLWYKQRPYLLPVILLAMILFSLASSFIAAPAWYQYFYAPIPFAVLFIAYGFSKWLQDGTPQQSKGAQSWLTLFFVLMILLVTVYRFDDYRRVTFLLHPEAWRPLMLREVGMQVRELAGDGKVLTLTPIIPLEGGVQIYPEYITLFVYRVLPLMTLEDRQVLGLAPLTELRVVLADDPPAGILVGMELTQEKPLIEYAQYLGYQPIAISDDLRLWMPKP